MSARVGRKERDRAKCEAKRRHDTKADAVAHARWHERTFGIRLTVYRCGDHWHAGHAGRRTARRLGG